MAVQLSAYRKRLMTGKSRKWGFLIGRYPSRGKKNMTDLTVLQVRRAIRQRAQNQAQIARNYNRRRLPAAARRGQTGLQGRGAFI